jgi:ribosome biogenesis protein Nip4
MTFSLLEAGAEQIFAVPAGEHLFVYGRQVKAVVFWKSL